LLYTGISTEMKIMWQLVLTDTSAIEWGTDTSYSLGSVETVEYGTDHQHTHTITGLNPGDLYCYRISAGAEQRTGSFHAAPADDESSIKFIAYGDTRTYPADHDSVAEAILVERVAVPDYQSMIVNVGDLISDGDIEADWDNEFFDPSYTNIQTMLAETPLQVAMGNHEGSGLLFVKYFDYPFVSGRYWSFDYGPAHFVVVDQYTSYGPGSAQLTWIENDLAATTKPWKFLYLHEPGWSAGGGHANNTSVQNYIQPLCETYGVPVLFAGHNHYYARAVVNGVQHITTGGGGAPLRTPNPGYPNVVTATRAHHYCKIEIDGGYLWFEAVTPDGAVLDTLSLSLPGAGSRDAESDASTMNIRLEHGGPNPSRGCIGLDYSIPAVGRVDLSVYTVDGQRIKCLVSALKERGTHRALWDGTDESGKPVASGIYLCRLKTGGRSVTEKLVLAR
jgi:hypothetical protein